MTSNVEFVPAAEPIRVPLHFGDKVHADDVARVLGVTRAAVKKMMLRGTLTRWRCGRKVYVRREELERLMRDGEGASRSA
jgi:excisionase family DNA binding protein